MKKLLIGGVTLVGGFIASLFGGWTQAMTTLVVFMTVDFLSGVICAGVFKSSNKTEGGGLSSKVGFTGLVKKCMIMLFVLVGARLDIALGTAYLKDAVCIGFCANELLSVIENAGAIGLPIPRVVADAIEILQSKSGETDDEDNA